MLIMLVTPLAPATLAVGARGFTDLPEPGHWSYEGIASVIENNIMGGYGDGTFRPDRAITLAEASAYLARAMGATARAAEMPGISGYAQGSWYDREGVVAIAYRMGIIEGIIGKYGAAEPDMPLLSEDAFDMMARAISPGKGAPGILEGFSDGDAISPMYASNIAALVEGGYVQWHGIAGGAASFAPVEPITRARFATVFGRVFGHYITEAGAYDSVAVQNAVVNTQGVTLRGADIAGDLIIGDGVGDGAVTLENARVGGRLVVRGGGADSIIILGGSIGEIVAARAEDDVRIHIGGGAEVTGVRAASGKPRHNSSHCRD